MKIGIITGNLKKSQSGISTYTFQIINYLKEKNEVTIIRHPEGDSELNCKDLVIHPLGLKFSYNLWSRFLFFYKKELNKFDIIHNVAQYPIPSSLGQHHIITIHDIIPIVYPQLVSLFHSLNYKLFYPKILRNSEKIIADSISTANDLINYCNISEEKIKVIPLGISDHFKKYSDSEIQKFRIQQNLSFPFILFVGALEPKKNITTIIKAFHQCLEKEPNLKLVIGGMKAWKYNEIFNLVKDLKLESKVKFLNFVPYEELPLLYNAAEVFIFPSLYEGFGLPPLEAMKCGTPVIVSNRSSLPEIVGPKGLKVEPFDYKEIKNQIIKIISDKDYKKELSDYYLDYALQFSWKKCVDMTFQEYLNLVNKSKF